jgi:HSP20 family protein
MTIVKFRKPLVSRNEFPFASHMMSNMLDNMLSSRFSSDGWDVFPKTNVIENETEYILQIAVPGMNKDRFQINVEKDLLTLSAGNDEANTEQEVNYLRREFDYTSFSKNFTLPEDVDSERISANYENGILMVRLGKKDTAIPQPPRKIEVK